MSLKSADLSRFIDTDTFPMADFLSGLSHVRWRPAIFYGDFHSRAVRKYPDADASRIRNHLDEGKPITEWHVTLTTTAHSFPWANTDTHPWQHTKEAAAFGSVMNWFKDIDVFQFIGRVTVFISQSPREQPHIDWETGSASVNYRTDPVEFVWLGLGGKTMEVNGVGIGKVCWFDNRELHRSISNKDLSWSIRADGKFNDRIRRELFGS